MLRKILAPMVMISMVFFTQCTDDSFDQESNYPSLKAGGGGNGSSGGGNGGSGGGNGSSGAGNGGSGGLYGDLIICLRTPDGIPVYTEIEGEQGITYYPLPIKIEETSLEPLKIDDVYATFQLNTEGEVIPENNYIVQEVDFGRLNIVRAPQSVLDRALNEAIANLTQAGVTDIKTDASGRLIAIIGLEDWLVNYDTNPANDEFDDKTIDSPRENIAIYQELMSNGLNLKMSFLIDYGYNSQDVMRLAYSAAAAGADKTGNMNVDEFAYMNNWLLKWESTNITELPNSPDIKNRRYFDYTQFVYSRNANYANKYLRIKTLNSDGTWTETFESILNAVTWTNANKLIDYCGGDADNKHGITGFAFAGDDAVQVLELIHSTDLIDYSPYFSASGYNPTP